jgi:hypothetical protein
MMTAEEFVEFLEAKGTIFPNEKEKLRAKNSFIEFAKLHVAEARKQFKIVFSEIDDVYPFERDDKLSDVYPLSNIK